MLRIEPDLHNKENKDLPLKNASAQDLLCPPEFMQDWVSAGVYLEVISWLKRATRAESEVKGHICDPWSGSASSWHPLFIPETWLDGVSLDGYSATHPSGRRLPAGYAPR